MGYSKWDRILFGAPCKKEEEEADFDRIECKCRFVEDEDDKKDHRKHRGCGCSDCQRRHHRHHHHKHHAKPDYGFEDVKVKVYFESDK